MDSFETAMDELGIAMSAKAFAALLSSVQFARAEPLYALAHEALHGPHGYAWAYAVGVTMLVVRDGTRVVFGVQSANRKRPFPPWGWKIERWSKNLAANTDQALAWAQSETKGVVVGKLARPPARDTGDVEQGKALLAAVIAKPSDHATRLVYADWLLERGDKRGDLIRLHQEGKETHALARKHAPTVEAQYTKLFNTIDLRTGFVERLSAYAGALAKYPELFEREPFREAHLIAMKPDDLAKLAKTCGPHLARLTDVWLEGRKAPHYLAAVPVKASSIAPLLTGVEKLRIERFDEKLPEWTALFTKLRGPIAQLAIDTAPRKVFDLFHEPGVLPKLRRIRVGFQRWCDRRGRADAVAVATILAKRHLASIELNSWHPGGAAMAAVVEALLASPKTKITISNCTDARTAIPKHPRVTIER